MQNTERQGHTVSNTCEVKDIFAQIDFSSVGDLPDLDIVPRNMCFTLDLDAIGTKIGQFRTVHDTNGKKILGLDDYSINKACVESTKNVPDWAKIRNYVRDVLAGKIQLMGKEYESLTKSNHPDYELSWIFIHPKVLCDSLKFFGIWATDNPNALSKRKFFKTGNEEPQAKKSAREYYDNHELFSRGDSIVMNNNVGTPFADDRIYVNNLNNILPSLALLGSTVFLGGKITVYFPYVDPMDWTKGCYAEPVCENYYGQKLVISGDPKYENFQKIGTVREVHTNPTHSMYSLLDKLTDTGKDDTSKILTLRLAMGGFMKIYLSQSAPLTTIKR